jgi:hypothetical protein
MILIEKLDDSTGSCHPANHLTMNRKSWHKYGHFICSGPIQRTSFGNPQQNPKKAREWSAM